MPLPRALVCLLVVVIAGSAGHGPRLLAAAGDDLPTYTADRAPSDLRPAVDRAQAASKAFQMTLLNRLMDLMPKGGPVGALDVCRREAYAVAADIGMQQGLSLGRTSHKLRNPQNAPKPWAAAVVAANAGKKAADVSPYVVDLGDKVGVLQPIPTGEACALCHGTPSWMPTDVAAALKQHYPSDKAVGFSTGDLRGWIWAEVPKR